MATFSAKSDSPSELSEAAGVVKCSRIQANAIASQLVLICLSLAFRVRMAGFTIKHGLGMGYEIFIRPPESLDDIKPDTKGSESYFGHRPWRPDPSPGDFRESLARFRDMRVLPSGSIMGFRWVFRMRYFKGWVGFMGRMLM
ncbi:hypothetical protein RJ640_028648 [Escallonia rubra]|uniref:Uncharacterized protein n=1 Tax=Escallonia rubra TaxID=112253 RepID=A0AA88UG56_9ASTE|nr:hypothetical protein RJ640_028648 [Escallonia rubra]